MMRLTLATLAAVVMTALAPMAAHAHFIWATVENNEVRFALLEDASAPPDARFEKYVTGLTPRSNGKSLTLGTPKKGACFAPLAAGQEVVVADSTIGVKQREEGETPYLLVYHAKGAVSLAAAGNTAKAPAELSARQEGKELVVTVYQGETPQAQTEVWVYWPGKEEAISVETDSKGEARVTLPEKPGKGFVGVRAMVTEAKPGELDGKKYETVHHWATLTFPAK